MPRSLLKSNGKKPSGAEILALYDQGLTTLEVSTQLLISPPWARRVKQERAEHVKTKNTITRNRSPKWAPLIPQIQQALAEQLDLTLVELQAKLGTSLHTGTLCRALQKLKLTFKKGPEGGRTGSAGRCSEASVVAIPATWRRRQTLVFLDETGAKTNFTRTHGRAPQGQRLVEKVPHGHWLSTTFLAGLRLTGWVAPLTIDGALNGELFRRYVEQHLAPELQAGDLAVMDNLNCHKVAGVRESLQAVGADVL